MGCGASRSPSAYPIIKSDDFITLVDNAWSIARSSIEKKKAEKNLVVKRSGWKTIRIFVSSTFKDFHQEREVLVKSVFPDLRVWCESRRLQLIECDLRWGVPKDFTTEGTLRACLGEIDRCYQDNIMPFFVNMTSERIGWVPSMEEVPDVIRDQYKWIEGLSVTEMEILHGAYRNDNLNALFLMRDPSFLEDIPEEYRGAFIDNNPIAPYKLQKLKEQVKSRFPDQRTKYYKCGFKEYVPESKAVVLSGLEDDFAKIVYDFFKKRIEIQYPLPETDLNPFDQMREQHESFMKNRTESVLGRDSMLKQVEEYIHGSYDIPFIIVGGAGSGKSSVMARIADTTNNEAMSGKIKGGGKEGFHVFYHFVGAVPGSTELLLMIQRLLRELGAIDDLSMPSNVEDAAQICCSTLNNPKTRPCIIIIDALNQFDEDNAAEFVSWLPKKLAPHIRTVLSMIPETPPHKALTSREPKPKELIVLPLDYKSKQKIVEEMLGKYNKRLDEEQMNTLLKKKSSDNPLWLSIACEELRVFGMFRQISNKINQLADGLLELEEQILTRFEDENGGELLAAALCLLEVSSRGLLEAELLAMLGDEENLMPKEEKKEKGSEKDDSGSEKSSFKNLPAYKWSPVYRALKPFLRPFGDSGEGRLDFYHRSLSKAVRKKYFKDSSGNEKKNVYIWWHTKLANFFENNGTFARRLEEYPQHLIAIEDNKRLQNYLTNWEVFDELFDLEYSGKLLSFWRQGANLEVMETRYVEKMTNLINNPDVDPFVVRERYERIGQFFVQGGRYEKAEEYLYKAVDLEKNKLGERQHSMAELYHSLALLMDEVMKKEEYMYRSQLPRMKTIILNFESSANIRVGLSGKEQKLKLGRIWNRLGFYYSGFFLRGGDDWCSANDAKVKASECVDKAIEIFKELNDDLHLADAMITKGVTYGHSVPEQKKCYEDALNTLLPLTGGLHPSLDRLYLNLAIYHEEMGDIYKAFEYFHKWFLNCQDLYGLKHPKTQRPINTLREPMYRRIANEKNMPIPEVQTVD